MCSLAVALWKRRLDPYVMKNDTTEDTGLEPFTEKLPDQPNKTFFKVMVPLTKLCHFGEYLAEHEKTQICKIM
jgi:hypothetical protein